MHFAISTYTTLIYLTIAFLATSCLSDEESTLDPTPLVSGVSPVAGVPEMEVVIYGKRLDGAQTSLNVEFNGVKAQVISGGSDSLVVRVPEGGTTGPISVTKDGVETIGPLFRYYDIIVAFNDIIDAVTIPKIYRNGKVSDLSDRLENAYVSSIAYSGQSLLAVGQYGTKPVTWVDSQLEFLSDEVGSALDVRIVNNVMYVCGYGYVNDVEVQRVKFWRDGEEFVVTTSEQNAIGRSICTDGTDVYISGSIYKEFGVQNSGIWKNGTFTEVIGGNVNSFIYDFLSVGGDTHALVQKGESPVKVYYWKNGTETLLTVGDRAGLNAYFIDSDSHKRIVTTSQLANTNPSQTIVEVFEDGVIREIFKDVDKNRPILVSAVTTLDGSDFYAGKLSNPFNSTATVFFSVNEQIFEIQTGSYYVRVAGIIVL